MAGGKAPAGDAPARTSASGWNAQMQEEYAGSLKVILMRNGTAVTDPTDCAPKPLPFGAVASTGTGWGNTGGRQNPITDAEIRRGVLGGCDTVKVVVPQLPGYKLEAGIDELLFLVVGGRSVYANTTTEGGVGAEAVATAPVRIRARYPCREQTACGPCTAEAGHDSDVGDDPRRNQCGWCAGNDQCVPKRDGAISSAECPGFLTYLTEECGGGSSSSHGALERSLSRIGVGVHVLNVGDVDLKAARFYADIQIFLHVEQTHEGVDRLYSRSAILDPSLAECNAMPYWRQFEPTPEDLQRLDLGLFLVNIDRYRSVELVRNNGSLHHYRVQSNFYFRTNISFWPMNTERLEVRTSRP